MNKSKQLSNMRLFRGTVKEMGVALTSLIQSLKYSQSFTYEVKRPYKLYRLEEGPPSSATVTSEEALHLYERMFTVRRLETAAGNLYKQKFIRGFCHLYMGQEAVAVGMLAAMRPTDTAITSYRCHAFTYLMGKTPIHVLGELAGRKTGVVRGKGGSMHMYAKNFYGGNGIVGAQGPLGAGLAFAHQYKGDGGVAFALYGDGASNQGQLYEAFNIAKLWNLPCAFVCENNQYGMGTSASRSSSNTEYYKRGDVLPGIWIDGMDVISSREGTKFAIEHCLKKGPLLVEMNTYRYVGHSMSDPGTSYRTREEVQEVRKKMDPINSFKDIIIEQKLVTNAQLEEINERANKIVNEAFKQAQTDPKSGLEELSADIYKYCPEIATMVRGVTPDSLLKHINIGPGS